ncbi:MAG TPA: SRPBCC domain-containing protein [Solirubrobacteraceae bacterium]|jgi:uncharacterized protein YndB with AHSA1/START domain|nr:SRPBCC domain-containing protein [Solirubrobacteraceae bacterium]
MIGTEAGAMRLERTFQASAEEVFDAWTNPDVLRRWWAADASWEPTLAEVDLRVGGSYRLSMRDPARDAPHTVRGEYHEVSRPARLVYSWCWESEDGGLGHVSTVTVQFRQSGERTTVVLEHTGLESAESAERHGHGWDACMRLLGERIFPTTA